MAGKVICCQITSKAQFIPRPLHEGFDVFPSPRTDSNLPLGLGQICICLKMFIKLFEQGGIQARGQLITEDVRSKVFLLVPVSGA